MDVIGETGDIAIEQQIAPAMRQAKVPYHLRFFSCNLSDRAAKALCSALHETTCLEGLSLHRNCISESGLAELEDAIITSPAEVRFWNNAPLSPQMIESRKKHRSRSRSTESVLLPNTTISFSPINREHKSFADLAKDSKVDDDEKHCKVSKALTLEDEWNALELKEKSLAENKKKLESIREEKLKRAKGDFRKLAERLRALTLDEIELESSLSRKEQSYAEERLRVDTVRQELEKCEARLIKKEKNMDEAKRRLLKARSEIDDTKKIKSEFEGTLKRLQSTSEKISENGAYQACPVCYSTSAESNRRALQCGHVFCAECTDRFQSDPRKEKRVCAICRTPITMIITLFTI